MIVDSNKLDPGLSELGMHCQRSFDAHSRGRLRSVLFAICPEDSVGPAPPRNVAQPLFSATLREDTRAKVQSRNTNFVLIYLFNIRSKTPAFVKLEEDKYQESQKQIGFGANQHVNYSKMKIVVIIFFLDYHLRSGTFNVEKILLFS